MTYQEINQLRLSLQHLAMPLQYAVFPEPSAYQLTPQRPHPELAAALAAVLKAVEEVAKAEVNEAPNKIFADKARQAQQSAWQNAQSALGV